MIRLKRFQIRQFFSVTLIAATAPSPGDVSNRMMCRMLFHMETSAVTICATKHS